MTFDSRNDDHATRFPGSRRKVGKGKGYWFYYERGATKGTPLGKDEDYGTPEFVLRYETARGSKQAVERLAPSVDYGDGEPGTKKSFRWLCQQYFRGKDFETLMPHGQGTRRNLLDEVCSLPWPARQCTFGDLQFAKLLPEHFEHIRDNARTHGVGRMAGTRVANVGATYIKYASIVFCWAMVKKSVTGCTYNPCFRLGRTPKPKGHRWTEAQCHQFEDRWLVGTMPRLAYELLRWLGTRRSCAIRLGDHAVEDGVLKFFEHKGFASQCADPKRRPPRKLHVEPMPAELADIIRQTRESNPDLYADGAPFWLLDSKGRQFSDSDIGAAFRGWVIAAGLPHKSKGDPVSCMPHGLRRRAALDLKRAGGSFDNAQHKFGWTNRAQYDHYSAEGTNAEVAASATALMVEARRKQRERAGLGSVVVEFPATKRVA
jgi:hypothetical protein